MSIDFAEAEAILAKAREKAATYTGPCSQCRFGGGGYWAACKNPLVQAYAFTIADAYKNRTVQECKYQRGDAGTWGKVICGPEGSLFEPGLWRRFRDWLAGKP
jgi:hypothetical protein